MDEWQQLRFLAWPWIVGSTMVQAVYILLWLVVDGHFNRTHRMACAVSGVTAGVLAFVITRHWDNSAGYWAAFTMGLFVLAGISVIASSLMLLHASNRRK